MSLRHDPEHVGPTRPTSGKGKMNLRSTMMRIAPPTMTKKRMKKRRSMITRAVLPSMLDPLHSHLSQPQVQTYHTPSSKKNASVSERENRDKRRKSGRGTLVRSH